MIGYHHDGIDAFEYATVEARWNDHHNMYLDVVAIDDCDGYPGFREIEKNEKSDALELD